MVSPFSVFKFWNFLNVAAYIYRCLLDSNNLISLVPTNFEFLEFEHFLNPKINFTSKSVVLKRRKLKLRVMV